LRQLHGYAASVEEVGAVANVGQMSVSSTICLRSSIVRYRLPPRVSMCQLTSCSWRMPLRPCYRQMAKTGRLQCSISAASFLQNWLGQRWMFPPKKALGCTRVHLENYLRDTQKVRIRPPNPDTITCFEHQLPPRPAFARTHREDRPADRCFNFYSW